MAIKVSAVEMASPFKYPQARWNPPRRTKDTLLTALQASIKEHGFWPNEAVEVAKDEETEQWVVADGHRRQRAAQNLALEEIPYIKIIGMSAQEYWAQKNGTIRPPSVRETSEAIGRGLNYIPPAHKRSVTELLDVYGDWGKIRELMQQGATISIGRAAARIANYVGMGEDNEFRARTIQWLVKHHMSLVSSRAIDNDIDPAALFEAISDDRPIRSAYA